MSTPLQSVIQNKIEQHGAISVAEYMNLCLYHPQHGYYIKNNPLGAEGDFTTAPEITPLFGQTLAVWVAKTWEDIGKPAQFQLIEGGPGRGTLMLDLLNALKRMSPACYKAAHIVLLEISPTLRGEQAMRLQGHEVNWAEEVEELTFTLPTLFLANELLDAFPINQYIRNEEGWAERVIDWQNDAFTFTTRTTQKRFDTPLNIVEESTSQTLVKYLHENMHNGVALFIDYGYREDAIDPQNLPPHKGDTLQALHKHKQVNIFQNQGEADLTSHVNFSAIARTLGSFCSLEDMGPFLLRFGLALRATQALETTPDDAVKKQIESACKRLISPQKMGHLFKALEWKPQPK